jgi:hypothetical protein
LNAASHRLETTKERERSTEKQAAPAATEAQEPSTVSDVNRPPAPEEDQVIERKIVEAELAGRTTVADALARQLDARRRERAGSVVLDFPRRAGRR